MNVLKALVVPRSLSAFPEELTGCRTAPREGGREQQPRGAAVFCGCLQSGVAWGTLAGRSSLCRGRMPRRVLQVNEDQLEQRHRSGNRAVNSVLVVRMKVWLHCSKRCLELQRGWKFRHRGRKNDGVTDGYINHTETQTSLRSEFVCCRCRNHFLSRNLPRVLQQLIKQTLYSAASEPRCCRVFLFIYLGFSQ